ncbi:helix-turn-helix domain-containing protein [Pseudomonas sp. O64]|uniref:helix-turn-helix domain-containing protein n=1 Tax=unclassified Pseudomonas TaxID=196821 RepID=UPI00387B7381
MESETIWFLPMHFPTRLIQLRKAADLTQQTLADTASVHVNQIRRYEAGTAQPTLEALIRLAQALHVSLDDLVFAEGERGPSDDLRLRFEAVSHMPEAEKSVIKALLDGMILKYQASRIMGTGSNSQASS